MRRRILFGVIGCVGAAVLFLQVGNLRGEAGGGESGDSRSQATGAGDGTRSVPATVLPALYVIGDSTAAENRQSPAIQGWGVPFVAYFDATKMKVVNAALGGRSSRTFVNEGQWDKLVPKLNAGDRVLIQWGHNDAYDLAGPTYRGSLHGLGEETQVVSNNGKQEVVHTFGWYMRKYVAETRAKGAVPLILSLTIRDRWNKDGTIERLPLAGVDMADTNRFHEPPIYSVWSAEVAKAGHVPLLDVHNMIADRYEKEGKEVVSTYFNNAGDPTHRNLKGAEVDAEVTLACLRAYEGAGFDQYLSEKGRAVAAADGKYVFLNAPGATSPTTQATATRDGESGDSRSQATLHPALFLIGDSIMNTGTGTGATGPWGWGQQIGAMFDGAKVHVYNEGRGGRSSRGYMEEGLWKQELARMEKGDFVIVQFGHNDAANSANYPDRVTLPGSGEETKEIDSPVDGKKETIHTYGWYLRQYVKEAKAKGAVVIVCSPTPRNTWADGKIKRGFDGYAGWAEAAAKGSGAMFVDLNTLSAKRLDALGQQAGAAMFNDNQHTKKAGAELNAEAVVEGLRGLKECGLAEDLVVAATTASPAK